MTPPRVVMLAATAAVSVVAIAACGNSGGVGGVKDATQQSAAPGQKVTLNYETWYPDAATLQKAVVGFEAANPDIHVNVDVLASQDYQKQLPLALNSGGQNLDVVGVQVSAMTNEVKGDLLPVSSYSSDLGPNWRSQLEPYLVTQAQDEASDKVLYDIPMGGVASAFLYYNEAILSKAGVTPPTTVSQLAADVTKISKADPSVTTPLDFDGEGWWQEEMLFTFAGQFDPTLSNDIIRGNGSWDQPAMVKALNDYKGLFSSGAAQKSLLSLSGSQPDNLFYTGKSAFLIGGSWEASILSAPSRAQNKISNQDWGVTSVPIGPDGGQPAVRTLAEGGLAIPKSSTHVAAAAKFIAYMTYGPGVNLWNANLAYTPVAKVGWVPPPGVLVTKDEQRGYAGMLALAAKPGGSVRDSQQDFLNTVEGPDILAVLRGSMTAQAAAANMQSQWTSGRYPHS